MLLLVSPYGMLNQMRWQMHDEFYDLRKRLSKIQSQLMKCISDIESIKLLLYNDKGDIDDK